MISVAYLCNQFPSPVEPYVMEEIRELRRRGVEVVACSARRAGTADSHDARAFAAETLSLRPLSFRLLIHAAGLCVQKFHLIADLVGRVMLHGDEPIQRRLRALAHTWLGAYYALLLKPRGVSHIHVHHGYFSSWIAMVAARLTGVTYSMTLHGSDLLVHAAYLDLKLKHCKFCITVSEFNRLFILEHYEVTRQKVIVRRMGVGFHPQTPLRHEPSGQNPQHIMLAVGRLHLVKNHAFLVRACRELKNHGFSFLCLIAGEGPERQPLTTLIHDLNLELEVKLLGHLGRQRLEAYYAACDLVVLTSRSEGIPLVLMEAMAHGRLVLAPAITGIPELVQDGETGFLYRPGSMTDFLAKVKTISNLGTALKPMRAAARRHVLQNFNRATNLAAFGDLFLTRVAGASEKIYADSLLQQI